MLDYTSPFYNPYLAYKSMKANGQNIVWDTKMNAWFIFDFKNIKRLLLSESLSSFRTKLGSLSESEKIRNENLITFYKNWLMYMDPPHHDKLKSLITRLMKERQAAISINELSLEVDEVFEGVCEAKHFEFVESYSKKVSSILMSNLFGSDRHDTLELLLSTESIVSLLGTSSPSDLLINDAQSSLDLVYEFIEKNTIFPKWEDEKTFDIVDHETFLCSAANVLLDGYKSTSSLITNICYNLILNKHDYSISTEYMEELLRYDPPFQYVSRKATTSMVVDNVKIKEGDKLLLFIGAANRDPDFFLDEDAIILDRDNNTHLSFGHGKHYCVGASLIRNTLYVLIKPILSIVNELSISKDVIWDISIGYRNLSELHLDRKV